MHRPVFDLICSRLKSRLSPSALSIIDESPKHVGHFGVANARHPETHFVIEIESDAFKGLKRIERHRLVNESIKEAFDQGLHSVKIKCRTSDEPV